MTELYDEYGVTCSECFAIVKHYVLVDDVHYCADHAPAPTTDDLTYYWPEDGTPSFVSHEGGADGTWKPLCDLHAGKVEMTHRFTPWGSWHCPECGTTHLIWAEDWPDAEPPCEECGAYDGNGCDCAETDEDIARRRALHNVDNLTTEQREALLTDDPHDDDGNRLTPEWSSPYF